MFHFCCVSGLRISFLSILLAYTVYVWCLCKHIGQYAQHVIASAKMSNNKIKPTNRRTKKRKSKKQTAASAYKRIETATTASAEWNLWRKDDEQEIHLFTLKREKYIVAMVKRQRCDGSHTSFPFNLFFALSIPLSGSVGKRKCETERRKSLRKYSIFIVNQLVTWS